MRMRLSTSLLAVALAACSAAAPPAQAVDIAAEADRIERDFQTFCIGPKGDPERVAEALTAAGWVEPLRRDGLRGFEERLPGNRVGAGLAIFDEETCIISRSLPRAVAIADTLGRRLAARYGVPAAKPDPDDFFCTEARVSEIAYRACHDPTAHGPASAALEVVWRPDTSGLAADAPATESPPGPK